MGLLRRFQQILPRSSLLTIYKTFTRSQLDYADIIYDQAFNCNVNVLPCKSGNIINIISTEKVYQELDLESRKPRR